MGSNQAANSACRKVPADAHATIRNLYRAGASQTQLARMYGVSQPLISAILAIPNGQRGQRGEPGNTPKWRRHEKTPATMGSNHAAEVSANDLIVADIGAAAGNAS